MSTNTTQDSETLQELLTRLDNLLESDRFSTQDGEAALALRAISW